MGGFLDNEARAGGRGGKGTEGANGLGLAYRQVAAKDLTDRRRAGSNSQDHRSGRRVEEAHGCRLQLEV